MRLDGATWCDVTQLGQVVALGTPTDPRQITVGTTTRVPVAVAPEGLLYLRADTSSRGRLALVAQGQSGQGWLWAEGTWRPIGASFGQHCVDIVADGLGWQAVLQTAPDRYDLLTISAEGDVIARVACAMPWTSQGFLDASDPSRRLFYTDAGRVVGGVTLPQACGSYLVGQDPTADRLLLADAAGTPLRVLAEGAPVWEPRAAWVDGRIVACSRSDDHGAVWTIGAPDDFPAWAPVVTPPAPNPEPDPEPDPVSYQSIAPNLRHVVDALHAERPALIHNPHAFTREAARRLHAIDPRWGDNGKRGNQADLSEDCVAYQAPGSPAGGVEIYDIIANANRADAAPAWIDQTQKTIDAGTIGVWVRPEGTPPGPTPTPGPTPPVTTPCRALSADAVQAAVRQELALVLEALAHTAGVVQGQAEALAEIRRELETAAGRREQLADLTAERLATTANAVRDVRVSGRVSFTGTTTLKGQIG